LYRPKVAARTDSNLLLPTNMMLETPTRQIVYVPDLSIEERNAYKNFYIYETKPPAQPAQAGPSDEDSAAKPTTAKTSAVSSTPSSAPSSGPSSSPTPSSTPSATTSAPTQSAVCSSGTCGADDGVSNVCGGGKNLFPILDPKFNLREVAKNMILLEDHLFHEGKRCQDCILKHCLTIEALLEEGVTLDIQGAVRDIITGSLSQFREIFRDLAVRIQAKTLTDDDCCHIAQKLRRVRKPLCQQFACFGYL
jgi:hypothetical protein